MERGKFGGWKKNRIQRALGVPNAEAVVALEIEVFPEQLYIKCKKGVPTKFAIVHLQPRQVIKVIKKVRAVA